MDWDDQNRNPSINNIDHLVVLRFSRQTNFNNSIVFVRVLVGNNLLQVVAIRFYNTLAFTESPDSPPQRVLCTHKILFGNMFEKKTSLIEKLF